MSAVLPVLLMGYLRLMIAARYLSADFTLKRMEASELERAERLYQKIARRLKEIEQLERAGKMSFRERLRHRVLIKQQYGAELDDLRSCAQHLRASINRLRSRPIRRLRHWIHVLSLRYALSGSLTSYFMILAPVTAFIYFSEQPLWARELTSSIDPLVFWTAIDAHLIYTNGIISGLAAVMTLVLYLARREKLYSDHQTQTKVLEEFASTNPDRLLHEDEQIDTPYAEDAPSIEPAYNDSWFAILGLSPTATIDEVKEAYKTKIKQTHPDRLQGMAATIQKLAEAETKKLNAAYEEALMLKRTS